MGNIILDHADIVVTHKCNMNCPFCIDKFRGISDEENFLKKLRQKTDKELEILLLGGEPTCIGSEKLIKIARLVHKYGFKIIMSTNGKLKSVISDIYDDFDYIQVTVHSKKELDYWVIHGDKINVKIAGDEHLTYKKLIDFIETTKGLFKRRSVSMYFTPDFKELCDDPKIWELLNNLDWYRNGSYEYAFYKGVRFKKSIHGETNIIDEPTVPKLYPNGNYNKTWENEEMNNFL